MEYPEALLQVKDSPILHVWKSQLSLMMASDNFKDKLISVSLTDHHGSKDWNRRGVRYCQVTISEACDRFFDILGRRCVWIHRWLSLISNTILR